MAKNMAAKRAAKASRRKAIVAEKRKAERLERSLPEQVRRAANLPIRHCVMTPGLFELGMSTLVLARGLTDESLYCGLFLLDGWCLGINHAFFRRMTIETLDALKDELALIDVEPSYARKLLRDLAAWSRSLGFAQATDFPIVEALFGDVNVQECDVAFQFGTEQGPLYVSGPSDTPGHIRARTALLSKRAA
jgi:hypothetical protein